jgi:sporulation protein YlmC with PRC-barrel domain
MFGGLLVTFSKLIGKKVFGANAVTLGEVQGADLDTDKWQITHLHVSLADEATKELGFKKPLLGSVVVCLPVSLVQAVGDVITLNKSVQELGSFVEPKKHP